MTGILKMLKYTQCVEPSYSYSDLKNMAFFYNNKLFMEGVEEGGLK